MGDLRNDGSGQTNITGSQENNQEFQTEIPNIKADTSIKIGMDEFPCFNVNSKEFYQNMNVGRNKIRFEPDSNVQKYMKQSNTNRKFYIKYTTDNKKSSIRVIN